MTEQREQGLRCGGAVGTPVIFTGGPLSFVNDAAVRTLSDILLCTLMAVRDRVGDIQLIQGPT